jgi:hypothetical protein
MATAGSSKAGVRFRSNTSQAGGSLFRRRLIMFQDTKMFSIEKMENYGSLRNVLQLLYDVITISLHSERANDVLLLKVSRIFSAERHWFGVVVPHWPDGSAAGTSS